MPLRSWARGKQEHEPLLGNALVRDLPRRIPLGLAGGTVVFIVGVVSVSDVLGGLLGDLRIASLSLTALATGFCAISSWTFVLLYHRVPRKALNCSLPFGLFLVWAFGSLLIGGVVRQGLQFLLVQVGFLGALLIASTARRVIGSRLDLVVAQCIRFATVVLVFMAVIGYLNPSLEIATRTTAIVALIAMGWLLAEYRLGTHTSMWWALALLLAIAITLSRTALLAGIVLFLMTALSKSKKNRVRTAIVCLILIAGVTWAVTSWAPLRDRFVEGDVSLSIGGVALNAEGRTEVWSALWSDIEAEPFIGRGPGSSSVRSLEVQQAFAHPHNDYLRVLYDFGIVGFLLLAWFLQRTTALLLQARKSRYRAVPPFAALNAGLAVLILMTTDNPIDYPFVMIPLGALIGLGVSVGSGRHRDQRFERLDAVDDPLRHDATEAFCRGETPSPARPSRRGEPKSATAPGGRRS